MKKEINQYTHGFKVHLPNLLDETIKNACRPKDREALNIPLNLMKAYFVSIGKRAAQLNDPILNKLMCELTIYSVANPESADYNKEKEEEVIAVGLEAQKELSKLKR